MSSISYTNPFVKLNCDLQLSQTANGVKLHFHNENPGNKKEQLPFYLRDISCSSPLMSFPQILIWYNLSLKASATGQIARNIKSILLISVYCLPPAHFLQRMAWTSQTRRNTMTNISPLPSSPRLEATKGAFLFSAPPFYLPFNRKRQKNKRESLQIKSLSAELTSLCCPRLPQHPVVAREHDRPECLLQPGDHRRPVAVQVCLKVWLYSLCQRLSTKVDHALSLNRHLPL